jgi:hypothetical protein
MSEITTLRYPINGIDRTTGGTSETIATCEDALNVRARSALTRRMQGGKRAGLVKLLTAQAGTTGSRRITGLAAMQRPAQSVQALQLTLVEVADDMLNNDNSAWSTGRFYGFSRSAPGQTSAQVVSHTNSRNVFFSATIPRYIEVLNHTRQIRSQFMDRGFVIDAATGNDVAVTLRARRQMLTSGSGGDIATRSTDSYEATNAGPFINGSPDLTQCYYAYIVVTSTNFGKLRLVKHTNAGTAIVESVLAESDEFGAGSSTTVVEAEGPTIRLYSNSVKVYATLDWPAAGIAVSIEADTDSNLTTFNRAGFLNSRDTNSCSRQVWQVRYKKRVEPSRRTFWAVEGSMDMPGQTTQPQYAVPPDTVSLFVGTGAPTNVQSNASGVWTTDSSEPGRPYLNSLANVIASHTTINLTGTTGNKGAAAWPVLCTSKTFDAAKTYAAEILFAWDRRRPLATSTSATPVAFPQRDEATILLRLDHSGNRNTGYALALRRKYIPAWGSGLSSRVSSDHFLEWRLFKFDLAANTRTTIASGTRFTDAWISTNGTTLPAGTAGFPTFSTEQVNPAVIFNVNDWLRVTDNGTSIVLSQNGCAILTIPLTGADATDYAGTADARIKTGYGFCILPFEAVLGFRTELDGTNTAIDTTALNSGTPKTYRSRCQGIRIVDTTQASTDPTPDVGEYDLLIVAGNQPHVAQLRVTDTITSVGSEQLNGQQQQAAVYGGQFYVVDGTNSLIVHPVKREVQQYSATDGIFPAGCEIIAVWRGRIVLARQPANPTLWFMSRVGKPRDWDFGSTVDTAGKAYFGSSGAIGQPADPITALAPFMDDFLIIGCQSSLYIMEGDPGAGGRLTSLNNRIGIVGPRAWCFDEIGTLYFVGPGGLYRLDRGSRVPVPVTGRKLAGFLDNIDTRTTMVQCAYDGHSECVHVFLTPVNNSTGGQHVVYEIPAQALWLDEYPDDMRPWAVTEIDGPTGNSRRILFGGNDGYVRRFQDTAVSDDGTAITSRVRFGPLTSNSASDEMILTDLEAVGSPSSGALSWYILSGDSADECEAKALGAADRTGTWPNMGQGWQTRVGCRVTNTAIQLAVQQVSSTESWAAVNFNLIMEPKGKNRKNAT